MLCLLSPAGAACAARILHEVLQPQVFTGLLIYLCGHGLLDEGRFAERDQLSVSVVQCELRTGGGYQHMLFHEVISRRTAGVVVIVVRDDPDDPTDTQERQ